MRFLSLLGISLLVSASTSLNAMDKEGEIILYEYTRNNESRKCFQQSFGDTHYRVTRIENLDTHEVRWQGKIKLSQERTKDIYDLIEKKFKKPTLMTSEEEIIGLLAANQFNQQSSHKEEAPENFITPLDETHNEPYKGKLPDEFATLLESKQK